MIVFFSSCELVEFHYHLFVQTLLSRPGAPASGQLLPSASTRLKFLRLHGNMEQEVSTAPGPGSGGGSVPPWGRRCFPSQTPRGQAGTHFSWVTRRLWKQFGSAALAWVRASIVPVCSCSGSCPLPPERAPRPALARVCLQQLLGQQSTAKELAPGKGFAFLVPSV